MRKLSMTMLIVSALAACGGGGGGGGGRGGSGGQGPVTAPTPPSGPATPEPPNVYVGGPEAPGGFLAWNGPMSFAGATGADTLQLQLKQTAATVTGMLLVFGPDGTGGPFAGTVSGNTLYFNFSAGNHGQGCGNAIGGTATVSAKSMVGTFSGHDCKGGPVTNGTFTVVPPVDTIDTTRLPVSGTWTGNLPSLAVLGGGAWTWVIAQDGDVNGGNLTGSVNVTTDNALKLGAGSFTGTLTNRFPGPAWLDRVTINASLTGTCASMLQANVALTPDGKGLSGAVSGSTCKGSVPVTGITLQKQ